MSAINRQPQGLLGFLGIKNGGRNPEALSPVLAPTWDLHELYLYGNDEWDYATGSFAAVGYVPLFTPPTGEAWYVLSCGVWTDTLAAGETIRYQMAVANAANVDGAPISPMNEVISAAGSRHINGINRPLMIGPQESIGAWVTDWTSAGVIVYGGAIRFARLTL